MRVKDASGEEIDFSPAGWEPLAAPPEAFDYRAANESFRRAVMRASGLPAYLLGSGPPPGAEARDDA